jgi:hypothetical protein
VNLIKEVEHREVSKLLVIDKNRFQGIPSVLLLEFVKNYRVVLPHALAIECLISENNKGTTPSKNPIALLGRVDDMVKEGACFGYSSSAILKKERELLRAINSVVDEEGTEAIRNGMMALDVNFVQAEAKICKKTFEPLFGLLLNYGKTYFENLVKKNLCSEFREDHQAPDIDHLRKWLQVADTMKKDLAQRFFPEIFSSVGDDWYTWQTVRLWSAWAIEWACRRNYSGPTFENRDISNDLYDIEYVAYLSRADGILTRDNRLVKPLVSAGFPDKDVFSCIEDVPRSYKAE